MGATISPILQMRKMRHWKESNLLTAAKLLMVEPDLKPSTLMPVAGL